MSVFKIYSYFPVHGRRALGITACVQSRNKQGFSTTTSGQSQASTAMSSLSVIPEIEIITEKVTRILGCNPGPMTLQGTNCHLVGTGKSKILIDTGESKNHKFLSNLKTYLHDNDCSLQEIVITHWHPDHTGGIEEVVEMSGKPVKISKFPRASGSDSVLKNGLKYEYVNDGHVFHTEGATLRAIHTPGHADDHMSLWLEEEKATFSGDTVLGEGTSQFEDLYDYMKSLTKILELGSTCIYPSHGALIKEPEKHLRMYIDHRNKREQQILKALQDINEPINPTEIVKIVYVGLAKALVRAAAGNVSHHLTKLVKEGKVVATSDGLYTAAAMSSL